jgi:hypothetical protein
MSERPVDPGPGESSGREDEPVLPEVADEDRAEVWGDDREAERRGADWYRQQRPPHHE